MFNFGFKHRSTALPRSGLLLYLGRPNLEAADVPLGDDTEIGDDTIIRWMFLLPADADIRAATGWASGVGNIFYDAAGDPVAALASEIAAWSSINQWNVLFHLVSADTETGRLAVYTQDTPLAILNKALKVLREDQIDVSPSAFFNGVDTTGKTSYTGGPTYVQDNLGVLRTPGANVPAIQGARLDGPTYYDTTLDGTPIVTRTSQPTRTFDAGFTTATPSTTFKRYNTSDTRPNVQMDMPGFLCEPARTNKCTCRKSNPVDTTGVTKSGDAASVLSVVDDTAALTAAGLIGLCNSGKVYKLDNSAGVATANAIISGLTVNTNTHSMSSYLRGSGAATFMYGDGGSSANFVLGTSYTICRNENKTPSATLNFVIKAQVGAIVYFILPQLEEGAFCTSPICKAADGSDPLTALTRAGTVLSYPTLGKIRSNNMAFRMIVVPRASGQGTSWLFGMYTDVNNRIRLGVEQTLIYYNKRVAGSTNQDTQVSYTHAKDIPFELIIIQTTGGSRISARTAGGSWVTQALQTSAACKEDIPVSANYQLGCLNSAAQFTGNIPLFETLFIPDGITDPLTWAKQQWGIS